METAPPVSALGPTKRSVRSVFQSRLLLKYALSYILIFLIPLSGVTFFVYDNAVKNLRYEIEQSNLNQLNQVRLTIDDRMTELHDISFKIAYDARLTPYMVRHPYYSRDAILALSSYKANSQILEDMFLYYRGDSVIYSSNGLTDLNVVFDKLYRFENWKREDVVRDLNDVKQTMIRPAENVSVYSRTEPMLALLVPIKPNDLYPYGTMIYLLNESKLTGVMDTILSDFTGSSYIFDQNGRVLTSSSHGAALPQEALDVLSSLSTGTHRLSLDGEQQSVVSVQSQLNGWTYVTTMPSYQFFSRVAHIQTLIALVFGIAVAAGIIAAMVLARRQYHPIKDLMEFARQISNGPEPAKTRNEWEWIRQTIHDYSARIDMQEPFVRNQCMLLLLKHGKPDDPEIERMIAETGLEFPNGEGLYVSVIIAWGDSRKEEKSWRERHLLQEMLSYFELPDMDARVYGVEFSHEDRFALMVSLPAGDRDTIQVQMERLIDLIRVMVLENSRLVPTIGVGSVYDDLGRLNQSFIEAATALEHRNVGSSGSVTYFDQLGEFASSASGSFWIPKKSLLKLEQSLKQGNESVAVEMIADMMATIRDESPQAYLLRCLQFELLNTLLRTASELGMNEAFRRLPGLTSFETAEELEAKLITLASGICLQVERNIETGQVSLIDDIVAYVDEQYTDYTMSLEHVALKYSISTSYLSRAFKEKTGSNFSQYVWRCRMEKAIRLLESSSSPLQEIVEQVGYFDAPNFIRKFKKEIGCTPGQYRKLHASNQTGA
ncbi:helix-turn-helix domain-containing protein [Cohnella sp. REN36]|uniref:helix-turn-helix domain-containing protein n=1 Tax=Cohnella sp. REN36 TaxID=2887347 RepID=UPI001D156C33|nr:helix-turn-helix domain-containing protein [Cohnella sp. REN36]